MHIKITFWNATLCLLLAEKRLRHLTLTAEECTTTVMQLLYIHIHLVAIDDCTLYSKVPALQ